MFWVQWTHKLQRGNSQQQSQPQGSTHCDSQGQPADEMQAHGVSWEFWDQQLKSQRKYHIMEKLQRCSESRAGMCQKPRTNPDMAAAAVFVRKRSSLLDCDNWTGSPVTDPTALDQVLPSCPLSKHFHSFMQSLPLSSSLTQCQNLSPRWVEASENLVICLSWVLSLPNLFFLQLC